MKTKILKLKDDGQSAQRVPACDSLAHVSSWRSICAALAFLMIVSSLRAQSYSIDWYKVAGGGGISTNGQYRLSGTIGQPDAGGPLAGGSYSLTGGFWALYAVQSPGAPTLFILKSGANAVLYWSAAATGYRLENNSNLASGSGWGTVPVTPVTVSGFNYVTNGITPGNNYYRLHSP